MDDIQAKIIYLEAKVKDLDQNIAGSCLQELLSEINIVENLSKLFNDDSIKAKLDKIKTEIQNKTNSKVYKATDRNIRINKVNQDAEKLFLINEYIHDCVNQQMENLDLIQIETENSLHSSENAYHQLLTQKRYLERKHSFIRNIFFLFMIFILLLITRMII